ncbi:hypothetical protein ACSL9C_004146, partial [Vibrio navarrensis]
AIFDFVKDSANKGSLPTFSLTSMHSPLVTHNAALRCEQRCHKTKPYHQKHKTQREAENAKRWESLLNALLYAYLRIEFMPWV